MFPMPELFISHAQNFEDVMLWRALKTVKNGFYIDVGANHPDHDSVTKSFYERGWRGINVEPVQPYFEMLCEARPNDINLLTLVADHEDELDFYESVWTGLSTANRRTFDDYQKLGCHLVRRKAKSTTLSRICEDHVDSDIHFLKIDVEGFEGEVLAGMDFGRWRPWILVIESPFLDEPTWKQPLVDCGYEYVFFDGLNGYYVAREKAELAPALRMPACRLDGFRLCRGHSLSHPIDELEARLKAETARADRAESALRRFNDSRLMKWAAKVSALRASASRAQA